MHTVKIYHPPGRDAPMEQFLASLDKKLQAKLKRQLIMLAHARLSDLHEPHFKHFVLERYSQLYELREKSRVLVRVIFVIRDGDILLLTPFIKRQPRDTMRALEASLGMLAEIREHPEYAAEYDFGEEVEV